MSFDLLAPHYRWMEWLLAGEKLQRSRLTWLAEVRACRNVLLVGEGPGRFLQECLRQLPQAHITCVDASAGMLRAAQHACDSTDQSRVTFIHAALPAWTPPPRQFDLIVTHFFFDCFPNPVLAQVIPRLATAATPDARWLVAEFHEPPSGWQRWRARAILKLAYAFFRIVTRLPARQLPLYEPTLVQHGFSLEQRRVTEWGLLTSDLWRAVIRPAACATHQPA